MKDYYSVLQLPENAEREEIQKAYRQLAKRYHPDVNKSPDAHEKFCEITEAYDFLMNHWPQYAGNNKKSGSFKQQYNEYRQTDEYEHFRQETRERAQKQAKMRYEKFRKQHEAFQESGLNDIALLFTILFRIIGILLFLFLFFAPIILAILEHWPWIFTIFFMWPFAAGLAWYYRDNRKNYFMPGEFYYSPQRIKQLFTEKYPAEQYCYYCPNKLANSRSYRLELLRLKEIKLHSGGFRQHNVNYLNKNISVVIPRSHKAFIIHSISILIKITAILGCLFFLNISSIVWTVIAGIIAGGIVSRLLLTVTGTKSNVTYLISYGMVFRAMIWLLGIALASRFYTKPFDIISTESIYFVLTAIIIFDSFLMQIISMVLGKYSSKPIAVQYPETAARFNEGFVAYNDIPVLSVLYPLFKWIFG